MAGQKSQVGGQSRQHYWDVVRGFLMLMGIPFHAALMYDGRFEWLVSSPEASRPAEVFADITHIFRMAVFFLVAGYFAAMMLERRDALPWGRSRLVRLGVPLACCVLIINPLQAVLYEIARQGVGQYDLPAALSGAGQHLAKPVASWMRHAWFLIVLIYFNSAAALVASASSQIATVRFARAISAPVFASGALLLGVAIGVYELGIAALASKLGLDRGVAENLFSLSETLEFAPYFIVGCVLQRHQAFLDRFTSISFVLAGAAFVALALVPIAGPLKVIPKSIVALLSAQMLLSIARTFFDRPMPAVNKLVQASFVIYLFHMPVVQALGIVMIPVHFSASIEWLAIAATTFPICFGIYRIVASNRWSNFAFNGVLPIPAALPSASPFNH